jgi:hypothetical protein
MPQPRQNRQSARQKGPEGNLSLAVGDELKLPAVFWQKGRIDGLPTVVAQKILTLRLSQGLAVSGSSYSHLQ